MPRPCQKQCCRSLVQPQTSEPEIKPFVCTVESCGASFKFRSVLILHIRQNHPSSRNCISVQQSEELEKKAVVKTPDVRIVLTDIFSDHYYCLPENTRFKCPFCLKSTTSPQMYFHLIKKHRNFIKRINPKVTCSRCGCKIHGGSFYRHRKHGNCEMQFSIDCQ